MGRNKEYRNAADKQKAYRKRKKVVDSMVSMFDSHIEALRYNVETQSKRGRRVLIRVEKRYIIEPFTSIQVDHNHLSWVNPFVVNYLISTGELVKHSEDFSDTFYQLINEDESA